MAPKDEAALEPEHEVLAERLDTLEAPPVQLLGHARRGSAWMGCLDLDGLPDERLQPTGRSVQSIAFGHAPIVSKRSLHPAAAGAVAATVWGLVEPLDQRVFRCDYSDVAILGKAVTRGPGWRVIGFVLHAANGAAFGLAYGSIRRWVPVEERRLALAMAMAEHVALYPLAYFVDRFHPARGERGIPPLLTNPRAFGQATFRHVLFGYLLGALTAAVSAASPGRSRTRRRRSA